MIHSYIDFQSNLRLKWNSKIECNNAPWKHFDYFIISWKPSNYEIFVHMQEPYSTLNFIIRSQIF